MQGHQMDGGLTDLAPEERGWPASPARAALLGRASGSVLRSLSDQLEDGPRQAGSRLFLTAQEYTLPAFLPPGNSFITGARLN